MKMLNSPSVAFGACLLILSHIITGVSAVPKTSWARQRAKGMGRRSLRSSLEKRDNSTDDCIARHPSAAEAPNENIWAGLSDKEAASVVHWLFAQPELNLTESEDAGDWDNSL